MMTGSLRSAPGEIKPSGSSVLTKKFHQVTIVRVDVLSGNKGVNAPVLHSARI